MLIRVTCTHCLNEVKYKSDWCKVQTLRYNSNESERKRQNTAYLYEAHSLMKAESCKSTKFNYQNSAGRSIFFNQESDCQALNSEPSGYETVVLRTEPIQLPRQGSQVHFVFRKNNCHKSKSYSSVTYYQWQQMNTSMMVYWCTVSNALPIMNQTLNPST